MFFKKIIGTNYFDLLENITTAKVCDITALHKKTLDLNHCTCIWK
jgi:hypothetical protein